MLNINRSTSLPSLLRRNPLSGAAPSFAVSATTNVLNYSPPPLTPPNCHISTCSTRAAKNTKWNQIAGARSSSRRNGDPHNRDEDADRAIKRRIEESVPEMGIKLLKDGLYEEIMRTGTYDRLKWFDRYKSQHVKNGRDIHELTLSMSMISKMNDVFRHHCTKCLYLYERCICDEIGLEEPVRLQNKQVWLFQTIGEFGRNNNSGSLLCYSVGAKRVFRGWTGQENDLARLPNTCIVFPAKNSMTLGQFHQHWSDAGNTDRSNNQQLLNIILLDGTPNEAANMDRFLPQSIPRIRLDDDIPRHSWFDSIRGQQQEFRVCTAQAAAVILEGLGEKEAAQEIKRCVSLAVDLTETDQAKYMRKSVCPK